MIGPAMRLFHPTTPPLPTWHHFASRDAAIAYCSVAWPIRLQQRDPELAKIRYSIPVTIPDDTPHGAEGYDRVFAAVCSLCPPDLRGQLVKRGKGSARYQDYPAIVIACAADAAQAATQLYVATTTGVLFDERRKKWEPFGHGYGCLGYYSDEAITYEPPEELDGRRVLAGGAR